MLTKRICIQKKLVGYAVMLFMLMLVLIAYNTGSNALLTQKWTTSTKAIYNGTQVSKNRYPYFVKLIMPTQICGGFLISEYYVVTAAHCVYKVYKGSGTITALVGVDNYSGLYEGNGISVVDHSPDHPTIFIPKEYVPKYDGLDYDYDIALIRLIDRMYNIPYLSFPDPTSSPEKTNIDKSTTIMGIGTSSFFSFKSSQYLKEADLYIRSVNSMGVITLNSKNDSVKKSACHGDSGGPSLFTINNSIYSIGVGKSGWCGNENSLYTSTSFNSKWITDTSGIQPNSGTATIYTIVPTQQSLVNVCYSRGSSAECVRYKELCQWDASNNKCLPN